jgi:bacterioferritin-associated ferredoxin
VCVIVCVCNGLREKQIRDVVRETRVDCAVQAFASLGCKPKCRHCLPFARTVVSQEAVRA